MGGGVFGFISAPRGAPLPRFPGSFVSPRRRRRRRQRGRGRGRGRAGSEGRRLALHKRGGAAGSSRGCAGTGECRAPGSGTFWIQAPSRELGREAMAAETGSPGGHGGLQKLGTVMMVIIAMAITAMGSSTPDSASGQQAANAPDDSSETAPHPMLWAFLLGEVGRRRGWRPRGSPRELVKGCALRKFYIHRCGASKPTSKVNHRLDPFMFPAINPKNSELFCQRKWVYLA